MTSPQTSIEQKAKTDAVRREAHAWRLRMAEADVTTSDKRAFETWRMADPSHALAYDQAVTFFAAMGEVEQTELDPALFQPTLRERSLDHVRSLGRSLSKPASQLALGGVMAASLVFGLIVLPQLTHAPDPALQDAPIIARHETQTNETRQIALSDGTVMTLGAQTIVETLYSGTARHVRLISGAALFDVTPDPERPFSVKADNLTATALGTIFDVRASGGVTRVSVAEGTVAVTHPLTINGEAYSMDVERQLELGQQVAAYRNTGLEDVRQIDLKDVGAWQDRRLVYELATVSELIADANRYDDRDIRIATSAENIGDLKISGAFSADNIDAMLDTLADVLPITVDKSAPDRLLIKKAPG